MKLYVVRNREGKYFRPVGPGGMGKNWQDTLEKARFYPKIGTAKAQASFWFKGYPEYGCPDILVFDLSPDKAQVIDIREETTKNILKATKRAKERSKAYEAWRNAEPTRY